MGSLHQVFGQQVISRVQKRRLKVVHRTAIEDSMYPPEADYTKQPSASMDFGPHLFLALLEGLVGAFVLALTALGL